MKKSYKKPDLKTRKIALGVFGNYGGNDGGKVDPSPVNSLGDLSLYMDWTFPIGIFHQSPMGVLIG